MKEPGIETWYLEVRKASLFQTWLGLSLVILPSVTSVPNLPAASGSSYSKQEWSPASKRVHPCSVPSMLRRHLLFSRPPLLLSFVFNRSAKRSMVSFSHTCSGCSLVLHNLLAEDTGPLGAAAMRRDTRAGVRPEEGSRARAGRPRSLVGAPRAAPFPLGEVYRALLAACSFQWSIFSCLIPVRTQCFGNSCLSLCFLWFGFVCG